MPTTIETELLELERQFWQAFKDNDVDTAMRLTDESCILTGAQGVMPINREILKNMMQAAPYKLDRFELADDAKVHMLSDDVGIVAYKVREELTVDGEPVALEAVDASTWIRRDGCWVCALHTESIAGDAFGRDKVHHV